jgi:hypothetical protein
LENVLTGDNELNLLMARKAVCLATIMIVATAFCPNRVFAAETESRAVPDTVNINKSAKHQVVAYYLYVMPRCQTCLNIEAFSKEAIESAFADELKQGSVEWHAYDTGIPEHEHYWDDFKLEVKSLIMVEMKEGKQIRWKNCEKVWDLVEDKPAFAKYVQDEVRAYLHDE